MGEMIKKCERCQLPSELGFKLCGVCFDLDLKENERAQALAADDAAAWDESYLLGEMG